ncbi:MAG: XRE family transcriptional regulator [Myxococcales bacterium]
MTLVAPGPRFVGRARELAALRDDPSRLVTLWGPGGIGKTRLALEHARREAGAALVADAVEARDTDGLAAAVARALDAHLGAGDPVARVGALLAARGDALLVVDNAEQATAAIGQAVAAWLEAAPALRVLVTTRERLRLPAEHVIEVGPLPLPDADEDTDATALLVDRVQRVAPGFAVTPATRARVAALLRALDGIPLAIELAAARFDVLGLDGLLEGGLLDLGARGLPDRQSTVRRALEWSWDLLGDPERRALAWLSVFRGGFHPSAALAVLGAGALAPLGGLRDRSLLWSRVDDEGRVRLGLLDAVRAFAAERLEASGDAAEAEARHATWVLGAAEGWVALGTAGVPRLEEEQANLVAVLERAGGTVSAGDALRAALALEPVMTSRGPLESYRSFLCRALALAPDHALAGQGRRARGRAAHLQGRAAEGHADLEAAITAAQRAGDPPAEADALADLGVLCQKERRLDEARACYERALALLGREPAAVGQAREGRLLGNLAAVHHDEGHLDQARAAYGTALERIRAADDPRLEGVFLGNLALLDQEAGDLGAAEARLDAAVRLLAGRDRRLQGVARGNLGAVLLEGGRLDDAEAALVEAAATLASVGDQRSLGLCEARLAALDAVRGRTRDARQRADAARLRLGAIGDAVAQGAAQVAEACAEVAEAARAVAEGKDAGALLARARARVTAVEAERSDDVRTLVRVLRHIEARIGGASESALEVGPEAQFLCTPAGQRVDLGRRHALRGMVQRLLLHRTEQPGAGLPLEALREAGWPGERMAPESGANRVYVAIATLRKLGLDALLLHGEDGYRLDERVPLRSAD